MKKLLLWGLVAVLLIVPFVNVKAAANVEITEINLVEATEGVVINEEPVANGLNISFNMTFGNVTDHAKYTVTVTNNDEVDYLISNQEAHPSEYMKYEFVFEDDSDIIEAGASKRMNIIITYENEVPTSELVEGKYTETNGNPGRRRRGSRSNCRASRSHRGADEAGQTFHKFLRTLFCSA